LCGATVAGSVVESSYSLDALLEFLEGVHEPEAGEDLAVWQGNELVAVWTHDGRLRAARAAWVPW
jgi:hypothetical protein